MPSASSATCALAADSPRPAPTIIVGTGPVGIRAAHELLRRSAQHPIVLYGDEPWDPYNRARLSSVLAGETDWEGLHNPLRLPPESQVTQYHNCAVQTIDRETQTVIDASGRRQPYTNLILATGARPHVPVIPGLDLPGVHVFNNLADTQQLLARSARSRRALIIGGGVLGLEAARALQRRNISVAILHHNTRLMSRQLDDTASALLLKHILALGIEVFLSQNVRMIQGIQSVTGVQLRDGTELECDTLIVAAGVRPNTQLARDAGLRVQDGIVVDDEMRTSDPNIYAIGDCAEHRQRVYGIVAPGFEQAAVAAHCLLGGQATYQGSFSATQLKIFALPVWSVGRVGEEEHPLMVRNIAYENGEDGVYRKLVLEHNTLIGAIVIGEWSELARLQEAVTAARRLWPWQQVRFRRRGQVWPDQQSDHIAEWPDNTTVCHCTGVTRGTLGQVMAEGGQTLTALAEQTGASRVCGSCAPVLAQLLGQVGDLLPSPGRKSLLTGSVLALLGALCVSLFPAIPYAETVQGGWKFEVLWSDWWWKQVSGYSIVVLSLLGLLMSLRKRWQRFSLAHFAWWRVSHTVLGVLSLVGLVAHTGFRVGDNANFYLLVNFLLLAAVGGLAGSLIAKERQWRSGLACRTRSLATQGHIFLFWPLLVLLGFHILSVYYY